MSTTNAGYKVVFKPGTWAFKYAGANQPGFDFERALVDFMIVKGLATNPSGDCCTLSLNDGGGSSLVFSNGITNTAGAVKLGGPLTANTSITGAFSLSATGLTNHHITVLGSSANSELFVSGTVSQPSLLTHILASDPTKSTGVYLDVDNQSKLIYTDSVGIVGFTTINDNAGTSSTVGILTKGVKDATIATRQFLRSTATTGVVEYENMTLAPNIQTSSYVLTLADVDKIVQMNVAGANTLTIPLNATVAFPIGTHIYVKQYGAGTTTITAAGGVTLRSRGGLIATNGQYAVVELIKLGTNEWALFGDRA